MLCTKKGSWAFCNSQSKEANTDGEVWGESVQAGEVSPISCRKWRISLDWLEEKGMSPVQARMQICLIKLHVHDAPLRPSLR